jgi:hypothetical protein
MSVLDDQGFEFPPEVIKPDIVSSLIRILEKSSLQCSRAGMRNAFQIDAVRFLAVDPSLTKFTKQALGDDAVPFRATLFDKSIHSNWLVVWHQDTALPLSQRRDAPGWGPGQ